jgi:MinD-like ATPase involved in chromosome partitioning or flagellar assembly
MRGVRIPHDLNGEDQFVLGLSVTRLAALLLGLLAAYTILHLSLPTPLQLAAAGIAALIGAAIAWVRPEGRSLVHWALAALEFKFGQQVAPDAETNQERRPKGRPRAERKSSINDPGPRLSLVTQTESTTTPTREPSPLAPVHFADDVVELAGPTEGVSQDVDAGFDVEATEAAPVYLGGPQVITFFSAKGGTGRTTLATEVAALLAARGRYRESPASPRQALRVVLIDFDLASANVSARLGIAQPTMLDYLCDLTVPHPDPRDYIVHHQASGLDVLLGPSKCLSGDRAELFGVPQAAHILSTLKAAGYQFLILDMSANLGNLETYLLETATRIYCVVTPTAGSVQSLYRGVEALRRLGLGPKLQYVANKMRDGFSLSEPMGDLNGSLVARIPYDPAFDAAENRHEPIALRGGGPSGDALRGLAASVYPALQLPVPSRSRLRSFGWLSRSRRAG